MGKQQSTLGRNGYVTEKLDPLIVTKGDDKFLIKKIILNKKGVLEPDFKNSFPLRCHKQSQLHRSYYKNYGEINTDTTRNAVEALTSEIEILKATSHPHIVSCKDYFVEQNIFYVVMDYCPGGTLATKIKERTPSLHEFKILSWIVEICIALRTIHEKGLLHKDLMSKNALLTEFGIVCLGGFGKIHENTKDISTSTTNSNVLERIHHLAPEVFTEGTYDAKSDIWSMGCILYELCTQELAFSSETTIKLIPKIIGGPYPSLPDHFSLELRELLNEIFNKDPNSRPTASEILERPFIIRCLIRKTKATVKELHTKVDRLRTLADSLERVHQGTTIGSLAGGVIGAVGGITSIVGLILAPFTLGASLIVTGVGVGVSVVGGATAGASNITNMVNQSSDRKVVRSIIKEIEQKIKAVVTWLQEISNSLQTINNKYGNIDTEGKAVIQEDLARVSLRTGRGLGGVAELLRLVQVMKLGRIAAHASRVIRVAEVATGVLSGLFVAVDIFFIALDAKEIHHIRRAKVAKHSAVSKLSVTENRSNEVPVSDNDTLLTQNSEQDTSESQDQTRQIATPIRSEIMRFVKSVRQAADNLQEILDELNSIIKCIPSLGDDSELDSDFM